MRARLSALLVVGLLVAGCNGGDGETRDPPGSPSPTSAQGDGPIADRPQWELGQGWRYALEIPGEPTDMFNMLVAEDRDDLWVVASDERAKAVHHAVYSTNPVLGRIGKDTLSPYQDGAPVAMYRFPLEDGKTWSAAFFGQEMAFTAAFTAIDVDDSLGLGEYVEGFHVEAQGADGTRVLYDFVEGVQWFTSFELRDPAGDRKIKLTLRGLIDGYTGEYHFYRGADALTAKRTHEASAGLTTASDAADVPQDRSQRVAIGVVYTGQASQPGPSLHLELVRPDGEAAWTRDFSDSRQVIALADVSGVDGEWTVDYRMTGTLSVDVRVVGILLFSEGSL